MEVSDNFFFANFQGKTKKTDPSAMMFFDRFLNVARSNRSKTK